MNVWHSRRRAPVPAHRCALCRGEGFLELAPLDDGRMACPSCRAGRRRQASGTLPAGFYEDAAGTMHIDVADLLRSQDIEPTPAIVKQVAGMLAEMAPARLGRPVELDA